MQREWRLFSENEGQITLFPKTDWIFQESMVSLGWMDIGDRNLRRVSTHRWCPGEEPLSAQFLHMNFSGVFVLFVFYRIKGRMPWSMSF